jgi:prepilin-type N-terminal cleavage/methylation domain-containing protein
VGRTTITSEKGAPGKPGVPLRFSKGRRGFTLVELMIVVAVIGILAMIAIPTFMRMRERARVAEAKANLGAIRVAEYAYFAEYNRYVGNQPFTPDRSSDPSQPFQWDPTTRFSLLGFAAEGRVYFSYSLLGADAPTEGFTSQARSDLDANGAWSVWYITSYDKELLHSGDLL